MQNVSLALMTMKRNTNERDDGSPPASSTNTPKRHKSGRQQPNQQESVENPINIPSYQEEFNHQHQGIPQSLDSSNQSSIFDNLNYLMPHQRNLAEYSMLGLPLVDQNPPVSAIVSASEARNRAAAMNLSVLQRLLHGPNQAAEFLSRNSTSNQATNAAMQRANNFATAAASSDLRMMYDQNMISSNLGAYSFNSDLSSRPDHSESLSQKIHRIGSIRNDIALPSFFRMNNSMEMGRPTWGVDPSRLPSREQGDTYLPLTDLELLERIAGSQEKNTSEIADDVKSVAQRTETSQDTQEDFHKKNSQNSKIGSKQQEGTTSNFGYDAGNLVRLSMPSDDGSLSNYQCLLRQQICLFEAGAYDINCTAQGRNKPVQIGQVGIVCRHCGSFPPGLRSTGSVYFPTKLKGLYQSVQNMGKNHFLNSCRTIPEEIRTELFKLKDAKPSMLGGGKQFWAYGAALLGVIEDEDVLRFQKGNQKPSREGR